MTGKIGIAENFNAKSLKYWIKEYGRDKNFIVLDDMESPNSINMGKPITSKFRALPDDATPQSIAKIIVESYNFYFAFYSLETSYQIREENGEFRAHLGMKIRYAAE